LNNTWYNILDRISESFLQGFVEAFFNSVQQLFFMLDDLGFLWDMYFNVAGFIVGSITVLLIFFAGVSEGKFAGFFRSLATVALLNSLGVIYRMAAHNIVDFGYRRGIWNQIGYMHNYVSGDMLGWLSLVLDAAANPIAGAILVLIVVSCYKGRYGSSNVGNAFCLGVITYGVTILMHLYEVDAVAVQVFDDGYLMFFLAFNIARAILLGFVCMILTKFKNVHMGLIFFAVFFVISRAVQLLFIGGLRYQGIGVDTGLFIGRLLAPDMIIFGLVFLVMLLYERFILTVKP